MLNQWIEGRQGDKQEAGYPDQIIGKVVETEVALSAKSDSYHRAKSLPYPNHINTFRPEGFMPFPPLKGGHFGRKVGCHQVII